MASVREALDDSRLAVNEALQATIAEQIDAGVPARDLASLSKRLVDLGREHEELLAAEEGDDIGDAASLPDEPWDPLGGSQGGPS